MQVVVETLPTTVVVVNEQFTHFPSAAEYA